MIVKRKDRDKVIKGNSRVIEDKLFLPGKFEEMCHQNQFGTGQTISSTLYDACLKWKNVEEDNLVTTADPITCSPMYLM